MTGSTRGPRRLIAVPQDSSETVGSATAVAVQTIGAGVRNGGRWDLTDCSLRIPEGSVVAVVGRNGAGKSTLLSLLAGLRRPDAGSVTVLGESDWPPKAGRLARVGVVAQDKPLYRGLRVSELIRWCQCSNPGWDQPYAIQRLKDRGVPFDRKVGALTGGQRTEVALALALAKHPSLLVLDEPLAELDPVARREVMGSLMVDLAERNVTVILSSHSLADLTRVCDRLILLHEGRVRLEGSIDELLAGHQLLIGPIQAAARMSGRCTVVAAHRGDRQAILLVEGADPAAWLDPHWMVRQPTVEDLVFAYAQRTIPDAL